MSPVLTEWDITVRRLKRAGRKRH